MDNIALRSRYPRHNVSARNRKRNVLENNSYRDKLARQLVISVLILMITGIIKNANTTVTNYISDKINGIITQNIDIQSVYQGIGDIVDKALKRDVLPSNTDKYILPTSSPANTGKISDSSDTSMEGAQNEASGNTETGSLQNSEASISATPKPSSTPATTAKAGTASSQAVSPAASQSIFITPVSGLLGDTFGERVHPVTNKLTQHKGIDIEAVQGASIKAAAAGEVAEAGYEKTLGYYVKINHSNNYSTIYAHCSELLAKKGQKVKQGDYIAKVGSTGLSTGTHLHFEIWKDEKVVNPLNYIKVPEK